MVLRQIAIEMTHVLVWFCFEPGFGRFSAVIEFYAYLPTIKRHWQNEDLLPLGLIQYEGDASRGCIVDIRISRVLCVVYFIRDTNKVDPGEDQSPPLPWVGSLRITAFDVYLWAGNMERVKMLFCTLSSYHIQSSFESAKASRMHRITEKRLNPLPCSVGACSRCSTVAVCCQQ